jgi:hypothetical protein
MNEENSKIQNPNPKQISNSNFQTDPGVDGIRLEFEIWNLFGIWILGFGISTRP